MLPATFALGSITYAPTRVLDGVKSLSYAANMLSTRLAQEQGRDEALLVSPEGHILETPTSSFFWAGEEGVLYTPPLSEHILDSITRRTIVSENEVQEKVTLYDDLHVMKEAFITSSVKEIISVHAIDDVQLGDPGPLTLQADSRLQEHIKRELR